MPERLRLSRRPGACLPEGARSVARPHRWGNPFRVGHKVICPGRYGTPASPYDGSLPPGGYDPGNGRPYEIRIIHNLADAVYYFAGWVGRADGWSVEEIRADLAGLDLACWCPVPEPGKPDICHAAIELAIANGRRVWTPDVELADGSHVMTMKRSCNGCGQPVGDVTEAEITAALDGAPLPDVRAECRVCSAELSTPGPA